MTAGVRRPFATVGRISFLVVLTVSVTVLFAMVWQSVGEQSAFASLERDGVRYIQALGPLEIALTNAESDAVSGRPVAREPVVRAVDAVSLVDDELRGQLRTEDRWAGLRTKIGSLPATGTPEAIIAAYSGADDLLLALTDKVRNTSKLIRDPAADTYYLEDGAAQQLPEGIVAGAHYTDLLVSVAGQSAADQAKSLSDLDSARSDLASNAQDLSDDVRLAVDGSGSRSLGGALLSKLDRFNRSIDTLVPLMTPVVAGKGRIDPAQVGRARDEMQTAAADLSAAVLNQIDTALADRLSSLGRHRLLAVAAFVLAVLAVSAPAGLALAAKRRRGATASPVVEATAPPNPLPSNPLPPNPWPVDPAPWAGAADPEYVRWERSGAAQ